MSAEPTYNKPQTNYQKAENLAKTPTADLGQRAIAYALLALVDAINNQKMLKELGLE